MSIITACFISVIIERFLFGFFFHFQLLAFSIRICGLVAGWPNCFNVCGQFADTIHLCEGCLHVERSCPWIRKFEVCSLNCSILYFYSHSSNFRTLLWLSVVSLPLMGIMWVLAVLAASENSQLLSLLLSACVILHAIFCLVGYCIINKRVRENLHRTFLRCMGRKVPLLDSSLVISSSSQNINTNPKTPGFSSSYDTTRRNVGISASSTTSRSTAKTSSSPYRLVY